jgi:hypothetical protein
MKKSKNSSSHSLYPIRNDNYRKQEELKSIMDELLFEEPSKHSLKYEIIIP